MVIRELWIDLRPAQQERGRAAITKAGRPFIYDPTRSSTYKKTARLMVAHAMRQLEIGRMPNVPLGGLIYVSIPRVTWTKKMQARTAHRALPDVKPDWDNWGKTVSDALEKVLFDNDSRICDCAVRKRYADDVPPGVFIRIWIIPLADDLTYSMPVSFPRPETVESLRAATFPPHGRPDEIS